MPLDVLHYACGGASVRPLGVFLSVAASVYPGRSEGSERRFDGEDE